MNQTPFLDKREPVDETSNDLPHWHQPQRLQFITWCLGDALPGKALKRLKRERIRWIECHPQPWSSEEQQEYTRRFTDRVETWLSYGKGEAIFLNPKIADSFARTLMFHEGKKSRMDAFVIMPNHVHCLVQLLGKVSLKSMMHSWRSYSALELNRQLGRKGKLWSEDYWDRVIRSPEHYGYVRDYIAKNPQKAQLSDGQYYLWMRPRPLWEDLKEEGFTVRPSWGPIREGFPGPRP